ncbi:hypothetical protein Rs2_51744 [Raphanus sativus]|nr:hypothetical protein Rs2_51744 [Raphanus sativus]
MLKIWNREQELKIINPAVKQSIYGEEYGCVDFYNNQDDHPDHPSMMNHTFFHDKMRMSYPEGSTKHRREKLSKNILVTYGEWFGCPIGTVPILRVTKVDLLRLKSLVVTVLIPEVHGTILMNLCFPVMTIMQEDISVTFQMSRWSRNDNGPLQIWPPGNTSCCAKHKRHTSYRHRITQRHGRFLDSDPTSGNWGLYVSNELIGFWPASRFKESLGRRGVEWGGEVYSPFHLQVLRWVTGVFRWGTLTTTHI